MKKAALFMAVTALFAVLAGFAYAARPVFENVVDDQIFQLTEHELFTFYVLASDPDFNYPMTFSYGEQIGNLTSFILSDFNDTSGIINFTPGYYEIGMSNIILIVKDSTFSPNVASVYFNVSNTNDPPNITSFQPGNTTLNLTEGQGYVFDADVTDPDTPYHDVISYFWYLDSVFNSSNRSWTYSVGYCENPNATVVFYVNDTLGENASVVWNITEIVDVNRPPVFNSSNLVLDITWKEDRDLVNNFSLIPLHFDDSDFYCQRRPDFPNFTVFGNENISVNISGEEPYNVSFFPDHNFYGERLVTITLSDGDDNVSSNEFLLNVTSVPDNPEIQPIPDQEVYAYARLLYQVNASDPDRGTLTYMLNNSMFAIPETGLINFTPAFSDAGVYDINVTVNNSDGLKNSTNMRLTIYENRGVHIEPIPDQIVGLDDILYLNITAFDGDGEDVNVTVLNSTFLKIWYNATVSRFRFAPLFNDTLNLTVLALDLHNAYNFTSFMLNISYFNFPPVIQDIPSPQIAKLGKLYSYNVSATDGNLGYETLTYFDNASFFDINEHGMISFMPAALDAGNYTVNLTVCDNGRPPKCSMIRLNYTLTENNPPVIESQANFTLYEDEEFTLQINATDPELDTFVFSDNSTIFDISDSGFINFTPADAVSGINYSFLITATDIDGAASNISFNMEIIRLNEAPYFNPHLYEIDGFNHIAQGNNSLIFINVSDEEMDNISFVLDFISGDYFFNLTVLNASDGKALLNFTPTNDQVGNYTIRINISDGLNLSWENVSFNVINLNDPPEIISVYPTGQGVSLYTVFNWSNASDALYENSTAIINISEGVSVLFNQTAIDIDGTSVIYKWKLDNGIISEQNDLNYLFDYDSQREREMEIVVEDPDGGTDRFKWIVQVMDINRFPIFGWRYDYSISNLSDGVFNNTVINESGAVLLEDTAGNFTARGTFTSRVIDFAAQSKLDISQMLSSFSVPNGTSLLIATATSANGVSFTNWTKGLAATANFSIKSTNKRYFRYKLIFESNGGADTPVFFGANISYRLPQSTIKNNNIYVSFIDLDDYFYDLDPDDVLNYSYSGGAHLTVTIDDSGIVRLDPESDYTGLDYLIFYVNDTEGRATSNRMIIKIEPGAGSGSSSSSSSSNTKILIQTQIEKEKETEYSAFDLITPGEVTVYVNETLVIPIKLTNRGNDTLTDITLNATSEIKGMNFSFSKYKFASLIPGAVENTTLYASPYKIAGTYEILVNGIVMLPEINDTAKITVSSREKGEFNSTQVNTKIAFTQDLLTTNPECLELNELLIEARKAFSVKNFGKADAIVDKVISDCKYLSAQKNLTVERPGRIKTGGIAGLLAGNNIIYAVILGGSVIMIAGFFLLYKKT